jgi:glycosyltransferase involved in cell wall biosynthesis
MKSRAKIMYIITKGNFGGAQRYVFDLATSLPTEDYDVSVAFGSPGLLQEKLSAANVRTILLKSLQRDINIVADIKTFFELIFLFRKERPDIVHLNSSKIGGIGSLAARIAGVKKIIFTGHGWAWNEDRNIISKTAITLAHLFTIYFSHTTIAVCAHVARQISHAPWTKNKLVVIHNGVRPFQLIDGFEARQKLAHHVTHTTWVGTYAELHHNKGLDILITAFAEIAAQFPNVGLVIAGTGEKHAELQDQIASFNLTDRIHLVGYVRDVAMLGKAFDIFVLPSRTEAFPYALLEAGYASLPVIATTVGGIPEVIFSSYNGLLIHKNNHHDLSVALTMLLNDPNLQKTFGTHLNQDVHKHFMSEHMVAHTRALYEKNSLTK